MRQVSAFAMCKEVQSPNNGLKSFRTLLEELSLIVKNQNFSLERGYYQWRTDAYGSQKSILVYVDVAVKLRMKKKTTGSEKEVEKFVPLVRKEVKMRLVVSQGWKMNTELALQKMERTKMCF